MGDPIAWWTPSRDPIALSVPLTAPDGHLGIAFQTLVG